MLKQMLNNESSIENSARPLAGVVFYGRIAREKQKWSEVDEGKSDYQTPCLRCHG